MSDEQWKKNRLIMPSLLNPEGSFSLILPAPEGLSGYSDLVLQTLRDSLESFILAYADPDEANDDTWYYTKLKDYIYELEQMPFIMGSAGRADLERYQHDPDRTIALLCEAIGTFFEEVVTLNREAIDALYEAVVIKSVTVQIHATHIAVAIRGLQA